MMAPLPTASPTATASPTVTASPTSTPSPTATTATAPRKPTNLSGLVATNGILLSWTAPSDDIDGYQILRRRPRRGENQLLIHVENTGNNDASYLDTDVSGDDEMYVYRVKAIRADMMGKHSHFINVHVSLGDFLVVQQQQQEEPSATPIPPTSTPVPPTSTPIPTATPVTPTDTPVPPTEVPPTLVPPLGRPQNLTASAVADGITLNWDAPAGPSGRLRNLAPPTTPGGGYLADPRSGHWQQRHNLHRQHCHRIHALYLPRQGNPQR